MDPYRTRQRLVRARADALGIGPLLPRRRVRTRRRRAALPLALAPDGAPRPKAKRVGSALTRRGLRERPRASRSPSACSALSARKSPSRRRARWRRPKQRDSPSPATHACDVEHWFTWRFQVLTYGLHHSIRAVHARRCLDSYTDSYSELYSTHLVDATVDHQERQRRVGRADRCHLRDTRDLPNQASGIGRERSRGVALVVLHVARASLFRLSVIASVALVRPLQSGGASGPSRAPRD